MDKKIEVGIKVGISAMLAFAGNTLEETGNKPLGKALNLASVFFSGWALKDVAQMARDEERDHAV